MSQIRILRITGVAEGFSFLILLFIAMPLKYYAGIPVAVKVVGWLHGILFMAYILVIFLSVKVMRWNLLDVFTALAASILPGGTLVLDRSWRKKENEMTGTKPD